MFKLVIQDLDLNLRGRTYLKLRVDYSALQINFNPSYTTARADSNFVLDGAVVVDPDKTTATLNYL